MQDLAQEVKGISREKESVPDCRVDAHVHIRNADGLRDVAAAGVMAVRDAGTKHGAGLAFCASRDARTALVCISSGWALFKQGGYGGAFGVPLATREDAQREIRKLKAAGAGIIKVMASGMVSLKTPGAITAGGFIGDELAYIVQEAAQQGLGVMAHANGEQAILAAARAGVRSVEHGFFMSRQALDALAKAGVFWTPTAGALARAADAGSVSKEMKAYIGRLIASHLDLIRQAHDAGVPLAIGTDFVLPDAGYAAAYEAEVNYFEQAGLSREAVMKIACEGGAKLLGLV
jgi:imidazolonepropionase-like amidohydrolase